MQSTSLRRLPTIIVLLVGMLAAGATFADASNDASSAVVQRASLPTEKDRERHDKFLARKDQLIKTGGTQLVFIGDSITDFWRADPQREVFEDYFGQYRPYNIGISGDQTQHVLWRVQHGELAGITPKVVVVMIGTNNIGFAGGFGYKAMSSEETAEGITTLVTAIRHALPNSKILLLGIFPRGNRADDPLRIAVNRINTMIARLDDGRYVKYLDIGPKFLDPDGSLPGTVMPDYLHPNSRGYEIWAEAIKPTIDSLAK